MSSIIFRQPTQLPIKASMSLPAGYNFVGANRFTNLIVFNTAGYYRCLLEHEVPSRAGQIVCFTFHGFSGLSSAGEGLLANSYVWCGMEAKIVSAGGVDQTTWKTVCYGSPTGFVKGAISDASTAGATGNVTIQPGTFEHFYVNLGRPLEAGERVVYRYAIQLVSGTIYGMGESWSTRETYRYSAGAENFSAFASQTGYVVQPPLVSMSAVERGNSQRIAVIGTSLDQNNYYWDARGRSRWNWHGLAWGDRHHVLAVANNGSRVETDMGTGTALWDALKVRTELMEDSDVWVLGNYFTNSLNVINSAGTRTSQVAAIQAALASWKDRAIREGKRLMIGNAIPVGITSTDDFFTLGNQTMAAGAVTHANGGVTDINAWIAANFPAGDVFDFFGAVAEPSGLFKAAIQAAGSFTIGGGTTTTTNIYLNELGAAEPQLQRGNHIVRMTSGAQSGLNRMSKHGSGNVSLGKLIQVQAFPGAPANGDTAQLWMPYAIDGINHPGPQAILAMAAEAAVKI